MNTALAQTAEQSIQAESKEVEPTIAELSSVQLAYVGGGMANFAFM